MEQWYAQLFWDGLTRYSPRGDWTPEPEPEPALEWTPSKHGREWHFRIREDASWHTGAPVTAAQCAASLNALTHPDAPKQKAAWKRIKRHRLMYAVSWRAVDATTLVGVSDEPEWALPSLLARPTESSTRHRPSRRNSLIRSSATDHSCASSGPPTTESSLGDTTATTTTTCPVSTPSHCKITMAPKAHTKSQDSQQRHEVDGTGPAVIRPNNGEAQRDFEAVQKKYTGRVTFARTIMTSYQVAVAASKHTDPAVIEAIKAVLPREEIAGKQWNGQGIIGADHSVSEAFGLALALDPVIPDPARARAALAHL